MSIQSLLDDGYVLLGFLDPIEKITVQFMLEDLYAASSTFSALMESIPETDKGVLIINPTSGAPRAVPGVVQINIDFDLAYVTNDGSTVAFSLHRVLVHEIVHAVALELDPTGTETNLLEPDPDYAGETVRITNEIMANLPFEEPERPTYFADVSATLIGTEWTNGTIVDLVLRTTNTEGLGYPGHDLDTTRNVLLTKDLLMGGGGDSTFQSGRGSDFIYAGGGNDIIDPGSGDDHVFGESGDDKIQGSLGSDLIDGGSGLDTVNYGIPLQELLGASGLSEPEPAILGPLQVEVVQDLTGSGTMFRVSNEPLDPDAEPPESIWIDEIREVETLIMSEHSDLLNVVSDLTAISGTTFNDGGSEQNSEGIFIPINAYAEDQIKGFQLTGDAVSFEEYSGSSGPFRIHLDDNANRFSSGSSVGYAEQGGAFIELVAFDDVIGSSFSDKIVGSNFTNKLFGLGGDDILVGGKYTDVLDGGDDNDDLYGGIWRGLDVDEDGNPSDVDATDYIDDGVTDYLFGGGGTNTYYASAYDKITNASIHAVDEAYAAGPAEGEQYAQFIAGSEGAVYFDGKLLTGGERVPFDEWEGFAPDPSLGIAWRVSDEPEAIDSPNNYIQRELFWGGDAETGHVLYRILDAYSYGTDGVLGVYDGSKRVDQWLLVVELAGEGKSITISGIDYTPGEGIADGFLGFETSTEATQSLARLIETTTNSDTGAETRTYSVDEISAYLRADQVGDLETSSASGFSSQTGAQMPSINADELSANMARTALQASHQPFEAPENAGLAGAEMFAQVEPSSGRSETARAATEGPSVVDSVAQWLESESLTGRSLSFANDGKSNGPVSLLAASQSRIETSSSGDRVEEARNTSSLEAIVGLANNLLDTTRATQEASSPTILAAPGGGKGGGGNGGGDGDPPPPPPPPTGSGFLGLGITNPDPIPDTTGDDTLRGGKGDDILIATLGNDSLRGSGGNDFLEGGAGADDLNGGSGIDTANYSTSFGGVIVYLYAEIGRMGHAEGDTLTGIENITGSGLSDRLYGDDGDNVLVGNFGNDYFEGRGGTDTFDGGLGNDAVGYGWETTGNVIVDLGAGTFDGIAAGNTYISIESFGGTNNATLGDTLIGSDIRNDLYGYGGDDIISGAGGGDLLDGGAGVDIIDGGEGNDWIVGSHDADILTGGAGYDVFSARSTYDTGTVAGSWDLITDFTVGEDFIDLSGFDADVTNGDGLFSNPNDAFYWLGTDGFQLGAIGGLRFEHISGNTQIMGDTNGDTLADFIIELTGMYDLTQDNFYTNSIGGTVPSGTIQGTDGDDVLTGTSASEQINGLLGNDTIDALAGNDTVNGGGGSDDISGGSGNDVLFGDDGNDALYGNGGSDTIYGGEGNDLLVGDNSFESNFGDDVLFGGGGDDSLRGGDGVDSFDGGDGIDSLDLTDTDNNPNNPIFYGAVAVDLVAGIIQFEGGQVETVTGIENVTTAETNDTIIGDANNNTLDSGAGDDQVWGGAGDDVIKGNSGQDEFHGGDGIDTIDMTYYTSSATYDLTAGLATFASGQTEIMDGFENIVAGWGPNTLIGNADDNVLTGGLRNDVLHGNSGNDTLGGGDGDDQHFGGDGDDLIFGSLGADSFDGGNGVDTLDFSYTSVGVTFDLVAETLVFENPQIESMVAFENVIGGSGNDTLLGSGVSNILDGGIGNDILVGAMGSDTLSGGNGADEFRFNAGDGLDTINDYSVADDMINFNGLQFSDLSITQSGNDVEIAYGAGDVVTVQNVLSSDFIESEFIFA